MEPTKETTPSQNGELVRVRTSQPRATFCIQVPMLERKLPLQKRRKSRLPRARKMAGHLLDAWSGRMRMPGDWAMPAWSSGSRGSVERGAASGAG